MSQLEKAVADLRHAYHQLTEGVVKDQSKFADGLIASKHRRRGSKMSQLQTATKYHIFGPGSQQDVADTIEDAMKKASRMVYMPLLRVGTYRRRLCEQRAVEWSYGFDVVRIEPIVEQVQHMGLWFTVMASFPDTDEGHIAGNHFMEEVEGAALLDIKAGRIYLVHTSDKGSKEAR